MQQHANKRLLLRLAVVALAMFGFGFALVPLYDQICEATGINYLTKKEQVSTNTQVDKSRVITVIFDGSSHSKVWQIKPEVNSVEVHPGELMQVMYQIKNTSAKEQTGQAIPSYAPQYSAAYFQKIECFCFAQQDFAAEQTKVLPVLFVISPNIPKDVATITLSYAFFSVAGINKKS